MKPGTLIGEPRTCNPYREKFRTGGEMYGKQTTLRMNKALHAQLEQTARQHLRTISDMIRLILIEHIDEYDRESQPEQADS